MQGLGVLPVGVRGRPQAAAWHTWHTGQQLWVRHQHRLPESAAWVGCRMEGGRAHALQYRRGTRQSTKGARG